MLSPHFSFRTLPTDVLHLCSRLFSTVARGTQRWQCPDCTVMVSRRQDLDRHMKIHSKAAENHGVCPDSPVIPLQKSNLDTHRLRHHSGNEEYKCMDATDCTWGASTQDALTRHRRKHQATIPPCGDSISNGTPFEIEPTADPSPSSWLNHVNAPADGTDPSGTFVDSGASPFDGPSRVTPGNEDDYFWTSPETGFQHGNTRYSPEAKQLYPAASAGPSLDDDEIVPIPSLGGNLEEVGISLVPLINSDPFGLIADAMASMNAFNMLVPAEAPTGPYYAHDPDPHASSSWDGPDFGMA
ncbi:uncharacterized protein BT62DRAFT_271350 [Guyanagaster necrorhizus]|uniref:C2H2-type domain-containing protein n=1 Tax=Guyanagaster necrorhizus TaxID=856835 RepID=A0A9P7W4Q2_9AGAR|nr:uncharacterized protein BT62DRAFT_271350 [Guyanagaster necrorhizus MCA 3950]KAG7451920.1 hypothetical protein BT62DRAFT_271350 [Guyanagaster necrorhizus MCA 3950]